MRKPRLGNFDHDNELPVSESTVKVGHADWLERGATPNRSGRRRAKDPVDQPELHRLNLRLYVAVYALGSRHNHGDKWDRSNFSMTMVSQ